MVHFRSQSSLIGAGDDPAFLRCPSCQQPVCRQEHVTRIAGDVILDCPTCWTSTVVARTIRSSQGAAPASRATGLYGREAGDALGVAGLFLTG